MKFIHIADVHLGANPDAGRAYSKERSNELKEGLARIIELCRKEEIDLLLIAGDLFHRQPLLRELKEVDSMFESLPKTKVILIAGNHDYIKRESYYRTFVWGANVTMLQKEKIECIELPDLETAVYGLSYEHREIREPLYDNAKARRRQKIEILLAHGGDDTHIPFQKNRIEDLGYDYAAFGHIHKPQILIAGRAAYAGALEPIDKNDTGPHGYIKGSITKAGCTAEFVSCAKREYIHMEVPVNESTTGFTLKNQVKEMVESSGVNHIYKLILRGYRSPEMLFDIENLDVYGNVIEVQDETLPAYDFLKLQRQNQQNLIGKFIASFSDSPEDSIEYQALCEGVAALMETKRG